MRRLDDLITLVRTQSNTQSYSSTAGLQQIEVIQYFNDAQDRLQSVIISRVPHSTFFDTFYEQSLVALQNFYNISSSGDAYFGNAIRLVQFSYDGQDRNYSVMDRTFTRDLNPYPTMYPNGYEIRGNQIIVTPMPSSSVGTLKTTYVKRLDDLDTMRAYINGTPSGAILDLTNATLGSPSTENEALFVKNTYVCISDYQGNVMLRNGLISSYNATTDDLTLAANVSTYLVTGYTLANLADGYLTVGKNTTTISKLPEDTERYLIAYARWMLFERKSSTDTADNSSILGAIENDVVAMMGSGILEPMIPPTISREWLY